MSLDGQLRIGRFDRAAGKQADIVDVILAAPNTRAAHAAPERLRTFATKQLRKIATEAGMSEQDSEQAKKDAYFPVRKYAIKA